MNNSVYETALKFAFLYSAQVIVAEEIANQIVETEKSFDSSDKLKLAEQLLILCRKNINPTYNKLKRANTLTFSKIKKQSFISELQTFPLAAKEAIILNYYFKFSMKETASLLNLPLIKVHNYLKKGDLKLSTYFPVDDLLVKEHFFREVEQNSIYAFEKQLLEDLSCFKKVNKWIIFNSSAILLIIFVACMFTYYNYKIDNHEFDIVQADRPVNGDNRQPTNNPSTSSNAALNDDTKTNNNSKSTSYSLPNEQFLYDPLAYKISAYVMFYEGNSFLSTLESKIYSSDYLLHTYRLKKFLYDHNYVLTEEDEQYLMERAKRQYSSTILSTTSAKFFEKLFKELSITEDEYILYYLYPQEEMNYLWEMVVKHELDYDELFLFDVSDVYTTHLQRAGVTKEEITAVEGSYNEEIEEVIVNPEGLPFNIVGTYLQVETVDGQLKFTNPHNFSMNWTIYDEFFTETMNKLNFHVLNRINIDEFIGYFEMYSLKSDDNAKLADEMVVMLKTLKNSIVLEYGADI